MIVDKTPYSFVFRKIKMSQVFGEIRQLAFIVEDIDAAMEYRGRVQVIIRAALKLISST